MLKDPKSRIVVALVAAMLASLLSMTSTSTAGALFVSGPSTSDEAAFVQSINASRAAAGLPALIVDPGMTAAARDWAINMASGEFLAHAPDISTGLPAGWQGGGENVGRGGAVPSLHDSFMNSPGHRANILDPSFNVIGVGVYFNDSGMTMYTTHRFGNVPGYGGSTTPPATAVPVIPTSTPIVIQVPPTPIPIPPTSTPIVIQVPPTPIPIPPTSTPIVIQVPPTPIPAIPATSTPIVIQVPPTATSAPVIIQSPPTATSAPVIIQSPPTATSAPVIIQSPPTSTPIVIQVPPTATSAPAIIQTPPTATSQPAPTSTSAPIPTATAQPTATTAPAPTARPAATTPPAQPTAVPARPTATTPPSPANPTNTSLSSDSTPAELAAVDTGFAIGSGESHSSESQDGFINSGLHANLAPLVDDAAGIIRDLIEG